MAAVCLGLVAGRAGEIAPAGSTPSKDTRKDTRLEKISTQKPKIQKDGDAKAKENNDDDDDDNNQSIKHNRRETAARETLQRCSRDAPETTGGMWTFRASKKKSARNANTTTKTTTTTTTTKLGKSVFPNQSDS